MPQVNSAITLNGILDALADALVERIQARSPGTANAVSPRLLSVSDTAKYLSRSEDSVRHLEATGKLTAVRMDGRIYFDVNDLDQAIQDAKVNRA